MFEHKPLSFVPKNVETLNIYDEDIKYQNTDAIYPNFQASRLAPPKAAAVKKVVLPSGKTIQDHFIVEYKYNKYFINKDCCSLTALTSYHMVIASRCEYIKDNHPMTLIALDAQFWNNPYTDRDALELFLDTTYEDIEKNIKLKKYSLIYLTNLHLRPLSSEEKHLREQIRKGHIVL